MRYHDRVISISEIDTTDESYCLSLHPDPATLVPAIEAIGLINPPLVRKKDASTYCIVCGFRRIKACQLLGWDKINVRILAEDLSELALLKLAIWDNRSHRSLNVIEQARGIERLGPHIPEKNRLGFLASMLGFPAHKRVFEKLRGLTGLPEVIQRAVLDETISFEAATQLGRFSAEDALGIFDVLQGLKLSQNKQVEIITLVQEIARREGRQIAEVLQSEDIMTIPAREDLNRNEKGFMLRSCLKQRRFPTLADAEEKFLKAVKALKFNNQMQIIPPPYFEGGWYTVRMTFKSIKDFEEARKALDAAANNPALKTLLEPSE